MKRILTTAALAAALDLEGGLDGRELSESGPGDLELSAKWRFFREVGPWFDRHAALEVGVSLPTGESDLPDDPGLPLPLAHRLAPGSGSTDAFLDLVYQQGQRRFVVYTRPGKEVFVLLEPSLVHRGDDEAAGTGLPTGGTELLLAPGVQYIATEQMLVSLSVELPVWQDLDRLAAESEWNLLAELRYAF